MLAQLSPACPAMTSPPALPPRSAHAASCFSWGCWTWTALATRPPCRPQPRSASRWPPLGSRAGRCRCSSLGATWRLTWRNARPAWQSCRPRRWVGAQAVVMRGCCGTRDTVSVCLRHFKRERASGVPACLSAPPGLPRAAWLTVCAARSPAVSLCRQRSSCAPSGVACTSSTRTQSLMQSGRKQGSSSPALPAST